jgi:hypothetical protein
MPRPRNPTDCVYIKKLKRADKVHKGRKAIDRYSVFVVQAY